MSARARYTWEHGLERNCPVHCRRKNTLMIFVEFLPSGILDQATSLLCTDRRMRAHWRVVDGSWLVARHRRPGRAPSPRH